MDDDMVLLDHFHPPLSQRRHWHAFHNAWATYIASDLNQPSEGITGSSRGALFAVAYRVVERCAQSNLDIWQESLSVGDSLPTLPLWLRGELCLPIELNATYDRTCREQRILLDRA